MKLLRHLSILVSVLAIFVAQGALAFDIPAKPVGLVNDYAQILTIEQIASLEAKLESFQKETTNEIAVVTIQSLDGDTIENVAQNIFTKWGIGTKENNNGALLLIAMDEHKTRVHTGYGLEGALTDVGTAYIQDSVLAPNFKEGKYYEGIDSTISAMIALSKGEFSVPERLQSGDGLPFVPVVLGFIVLQWFAAIFSRSKSWWAGGVVGGGLGVINILLNIFALSFFVKIILGVGLLLFGLLLDFVVSKNYQKVSQAGGRSPWWGGGGWGGGSGGGGGGFGGFSGGSSGGGGSSGSW